jgi:phosphoglycolate phosphatase-like HAD superfamily hydrolase
MLCSFWQGARASTTSPATPAGIHATYVQQLSFGRVTSMTDPQAALREFKPERPFFVGIDSDGCAFDTMELKHKECFIPNIVKFYDLQAVSKYAREAAEFVNLYSKWRGINRFPALEMVLELLEERPEVAKRGVKIPNRKALGEFIRSGVPLGNPALKAAVEKTGDGDLGLLLRWSETVNASIADMVHGVSPFPYVRECLAELRPHADMMCVSATPLGALRAEWEEHGIAGYVRLIVGQEIASKKEALRYAAAAGYEKGKVLMIGDAPGDREAAHSNGALFYPVVPGEEDASWERLFREALGRFLTGTYAGQYERALIDHFEKRLPSTPPWKR